jgi:hypothetical protein
MIHAPFTPAAGSAVLALIAQLALIVAGLAIMINMRKIGGRAILVGIFLALMAGVLPRILS